MAAWIFKMLNPKLLHNIHCLHYDYNTHDKGTLVSKIDTSGVFCVSWMLKLGFGAKKQNQNQNKIKIKYNKIE